LSPKSKKRNARRPSDDAETGAIARGLSRPMHLHQQGPNGLSREDDMTMQGLAQVVAAGAGAWLRPFLISLHESRRRQATIERARYRHLIYEPETVISVGMSFPSQKITPAE
jgi:hypothetical protein